MPRPHPLTRATARIRTGPTVLRRIKVRRQQWELWTFCTRWAALVESQVPCFGVACGGRHASCRRYLNAELIPTCAVVRGTCCNERGEFPGYRPVAGA
jgi:hypothetical protein